MMANTLAPVNKIPPPPLTFSPSFVDLAWREVSGIAVERAPRPADFSVPILPFAFVFAVAFHLQSEI